MSEMATPQRYGAPAHLAAATAVARERYLLSCPAAMAYRLLELCASALCPAGMCWLVDPCAMLPLFVLLWYLPAAVRLGSLTKPLQYPMLCFVVDGVSLLGLHPLPRAAQGIYAVCLLRVLVLFSLFPMCSEWSPIPSEVKDLVINWKVLELFGRAEASESAEVVHMAELWLGASALILALSLLWVLITLVMLCCSAFDGKSDHDSLRKIDALAADVKRASDLTPQECYADLVKLRLTHPGLQFANLFTTAGPAWASVLHLVMDAGNVCSLFLHSRWTLAVPLAVSVFASLVYLYRSAFGQQHLARQVMLSLKRGLFTDGYMVAVRGDKGVLRIPETVLKVYSLPFAAKGLLPVLAAVLSIAGNVVLVAKFVFTEFDLGIQDTDFDYKRPGRPNKED